MPIAAAIGINKIFVVYPTANGTAQPGAYAVVHHHKQTLRATADGLIGRSFHKQRTRNIKKVERHTIYNAT